jgi:hypothetical protein
VAADSNNIKPTPCARDGLQPRLRWRPRTMAQAIAWFCLRDETAVLTPAMIPKMIPKVEEAGKELIRESINELTRAIRAAARGRPIGVLAAMARASAEDEPFRILGLSLSDVATLLQNGDLAPEDIRWERDVEYNLNWLIWMWPPPAFAANTSMPVANMESSVAKSEPAACAEESTPNPASPVESEPTPPTEPPRGEPTLVSSAPEVESKTLPPTTPPDESTSDQVESDTPNNSARQPRPGDTKVKDFVGAYIENAKASGQTPTQRGLWEVARTRLPGATRGRLYGELEKQTQPLPPGRPRKDRE